MDYHWKLPKPSQQWLGDETSHYTLGQHWAPYGEGKIGLIACRTGEFGARTARWFSKAEGNMGASTVDGHWAEGLRRGC